MNDFEKDLKEFMDKYSKIESLVAETCAPPDNSNEINLSELIREAIDDVFNSDDEFNTINRLHDKLNTLLNDMSRIDQAKTAIVICDKFEDYMKNIDKLNALVNEFKGCVSLARASIAERKESNFAFELGLQSEIRKIHEEQKKTNELLRHLLDFHAYKTWAGNIALTKEE